MTRIRPAMVRDRGFSGLHPQVVALSVGDTITWIGGFRTITFGPDSVRTQLEKNLFVPVPQASGAPKLVFNPKIAFGVRGTYRGRLTLSLSCVASRPSRSSRSTSVRSQGRSASV